MRAVTTPTGTSSGARAVREMVSHKTRNAAPPNADAGSTSRWSDSDQQADQVRDHDADEADRAAERDRGAGGERGAEERQALRRGAHRHRGCDALSSPTDSRFSARGSTAKARERQRKWAAPPPASGLRSC